MAVQYISLAQQGFGSGADDIQQAAQQALINRQMREKLAAEKAKAPLEAEKLRQEAAWYRDRAETQLKVAQTNAEKAIAVAEEKSRAAEVNRRLVEEFRAREEAARLAAEASGKDKDRAERERAAKADELLKAGELAVKKAEAEAQAAVAAAAEARKLSATIPTIKNAETGQAIPVTRNPDGSLNFDPSGMRQVQDEQSADTAQRDMDKALVAEFADSATGTPKKAWWRSALPWTADTDIQAAAPDKKAAFAALLGNRGAFQRAGGNPDAFSPYLKDLGVTQSQSLDPYKPVAPTPAALPTPAPAPIPSEDTTARVLSVPEPAKAPPAQPSTATTKFSSLPVGAEFVTKDGKRWRKTGPLKTDRELVSGAPSGQ